MLASFLFTDENIDPSIYSSHTEKPTEWLTVHTCSNQEERRHDKTPAYKINVQSLMTSARRDTSGWQYTSLILVHHEVSINYAYYCHVMLLQQFLLAKRHISSKFIFQHDSAPAHTALGQSAFLPVTSPDVDRLKNSFRADYAVNLW